ncbi:hypothetical protein ANCDUO_02943 [Ancylostoma duodenale]|uniref:Uncharacterized protein n=1 Tax=Ancylostoma duodenale TaxID=51022 RepID=A0A0C2DV43_9BILA|nr:hypothetical protein ANCDUO_02943 [Ancylostoma duodenale]
MVPPPSISSSLVNDVIETARRKPGYVAMEAELGSVQDHENLEDLLLWFICSHDCGMPILHMVCLAYIASIHANQYMRDFTEGSMVGDPYILSLT